MPHVKALQRRGAGDIWDLLTRGVDRMWEKRIGGDHESQQQQQQQQQHSTEKLSKTIYVTQYITVTTSGYDGQYQTYPPGDVALTPFAETAPTTAAPRPSFSSLKDTILPLALMPPASSISLQTTLSLDTSIPSYLITALGSTEMLGVRPTLATGAEALASATSTTAPSSAKSSGPKAAIAIGVLGAALAVFLLAFILFNNRREKLAAASLARKRDSIENDDDDLKEKGHVPSPPSPALSMCTSATAPQLKLRPLTQFEPYLSSKSQRPDRRASLGAGLMLQTQLPPITTDESMWERPTSRSREDADDPFTNEAAPSNPFRDHPDDRFSEPLSPVESDVGIAKTTDSPPPPLPASERMVSATAIAGAQAAFMAGAAAGLTRKTSLRRNGSPQLDLTAQHKLALAPVPPSPAGTEFSETSIASGQSMPLSASAAAGGLRHSTVHRVQLDFAPTLEDELGLMAGQVVRLLHEYDDGWALCTRLDRSEQGVVPRTCLSTRPVKPRSAAHSSRPGPPMNRQRRSPPPGRPSFNLHDRPQSSGMVYHHQQRPESPAGYEPPPHRQ